MNARDDAVWVADTISQQKAEVERLSRQLAEAREALEDLVSDAEKQMANPSHHMPFSLPKARRVLQSRYMNMTDQKKREPEFDPAEVRALSVAVYKARLVQDSGEGAVERMIAADKDTGEKLAGRAAAYDALTRCYMRVARLAQSAAYRTDDGSPKPDMSTT
jgi:hypothetical protein